MSDRPARTSLFRPAGGVDQTVLLEQRDMVREINRRGFLRAATKLGFKTPKWITVIEVLRSNPGGYWEDRGYNWFSGI